MLLNFLGGRTAPWNSIKDKNKRIEIIKSFLDSITEEKTREKPVIFACAVHKVSFPGRDPLLLAFEDLCSRFNLYINRVFKEKREKHKGMIILDNHSSEDSLQKLLKKFTNSGTRWGDLKDIPEIPLFVDSKASRLIQLADHIAYAVFRRYNAGDINYFNIIEDKFDSEDGKIHGLAHKQNYKSNCTCPACLQK